MREFLFSINTHRRVLASILILLVIGCRKSYDDKDNSPLSPVDVGVKDLSLNKRAKTITGSYGVLTTDQRFESTDIVTLSSGALMAVLGNNFDNCSHAIYKCYSYDNGTTWTSPSSMNVPPTDFKFSACNLFKVGPRLFLLLNRVAGKHGTREGGLPAICYSDDEGITWTKPELILNTAEKEMVIINSRNITVSRSGRIVIPVSGGQFGPESYRISIIYSDNNGRSWKQVANVFKGINCAQGKFAEPSVGQLNDGRLIMLIRTSLGHIYKSYSADNALSWSKPECTTLVSPWTAHSIRITRHGYIVVAYTNTISRGNPEYPRNNFKFAVSYDAGKTWRPSGTIIEIPEMEYEFLMEPNITFLRNDRCLVTYYRQLNRTTHRIETAIFSTAAILRDEENWEDLRWWSISGDGIVSARNNKLHLSCGINAVASVYKSQIVARSYVVEFKARINQFAEQGDLKGNSTLGVQIINGRRLLFKIEADAIYVLDSTNAWAGYSIPLFSNAKYDWHDWRFEVKHSKARIFMDGVNVIKEYALPPAPREQGMFSFFSSAHSAQQPDVSIDFTSYDPLN